MNSEAAISNTSFDCCCGVASGCPGPLSRSSGSAVGLSWPCPVAVRSDRRGIALWVPRTGQALIEGHDSTFAVVGDGRPGQTTGSASVPASLGDVLDLLAWSHGNRGRTARQRIVKAVGTNPS